MLDTCRDPTLGGEFHENVDHEQLGIRLSMPV